MDYGTAATAPTAPTVDNLKFTGWDVDFSNVTENLTVKAVYVSNLYTLTYDTDGGTELADETYYVGDIPVKPATPTKSGYYFIGWYTDAELTAAYNFNVAFEADTTLYAKFSESIPIYTAEDLQKIRSQTSGKFYLANDIDLEGGLWTPTYFYGTLDGEGHTIKNFVISVTGTSNAGFFTTLSYNAVIKNLTFSDFSFAISTTNGTAFHAGTIAGTNSGKIENCHIKDAVLSYSFEIEKSGNATYQSYAGGLVGQNSGTISNCTVSAEMSGVCSGYANNTSQSDKSLISYLYIGGIAGKNSGTIRNTIVNVEQTFTAISKASGHYYYGWYDAYAHSALYIGGAVADNSGTITETQVECAISVSDQKVKVNDGGYLRCYTYIGGFVFSNQGTISGCVAKGSATVATTTFYDVEMGGFASDNHKTISNCYADVDLLNKSTSLNTDAADPNQIGGFVGCNLGSITNCYAMGDIDNYCSSGEMYVGGFVGWNKNGATISKSFCTGNITVRNRTNLGYFVGKAESGSTLFKSYYNKEMVVKYSSSVTTPTNTDGVAETVANLQSTALLVDTLSWKEDVWNFTAGAYPTLAWESIEE